MLMEITTDIRPYLEFCLEMEHAASRPYTRFVFDDPSEAITLQRFLAERDLAEFSPPYGRVMLHNGRPVGMVTGCPGAELKTLRLKSAFALVKEKYFPAGSPIPARIHMAARTLMPPNDDDFYSGRLGIHPSIREAGLGLTLMEKVVEEGRARGFRRVIGEVHPSVKNMLRLCCEGLGFREIERRRVEDPQTSRVLEYVHIAKDLTE
jgi:GNAT superfamily N-acetyltransferase